MAQSPFNLIKGLSYVESRTSTVGISNIGEFSIRDLVGSSNLSKIVSIMTVDDTNYTIQYSGNGWCTLMYKAGTHAGNDNVKFRVYLYDMGGVIAKLLRALSHRWRHEQPDGITTTEDKVQGCNDTIHNNDWKRVRFHRRQISERNEQFSVCDSLGLWECFRSNMFRCERRRKLYSWRARKHNYTFSNTVFLHGLTAIPERGCA